MWIARDECGKLYIYEQKPVKVHESGIWSANGSICVLDFDKGFNGFDSICWEDDEPWELVLKEGGEG